MKQSKNTFPQNDIDEISTYLAEQGVEDNPKAAIILGSGLGDFSERIDNPTSVDYASIPGFPSTSVKGHSGELISGTINGNPVIAFAGRFHHYEGHSFERTILPVRLAHALGSEKLLLSNAAGGINYLFEVGDLMLIDDIMHTGYSLSPFDGKRFTYDHYPAVRSAQEIAFRQGIPVQRGTYMYAKGPNYETKAEIRAFRRMGADAVGMSTAPELIEASRLGLKTVAVSLISNMAAGVVQGTLDHEEVKKAAEGRKQEFGDLVEAFIEEL